jgi:hypothetical protein
MDETGMVIKLISRFYPGQSGAFWIGVLLIVAVAWGFEQLKSRRNLSLLLLMLPALPLMELVWVQRVGIRLHGHRCEVLLEIDATLTRRLLLMAVGLCHVTRQEYHRMASQPAVKRTQTAVRACPRPEPERPVRP